jgi:hypothetical protein
MSYFYLIEVDPRSPLDMDIQCKIASSIHGQHKRGYRNYYRVTADDLSEAVGRLLINHQLLDQRKIYRQQEIEENE